MGTGSADVMIVDMSIAAAIHKEINDARTAARPILHIRVSRDAIPGSLATTPLTPERVRALRPYVIHLQGRNEPDVFADPEVVERSLEIVLHPKDWMQLRADLEAILYLQLPLREGEPTRVFGIPVTE